MPEWKCLWILKKVEYLELINPQHSPDNRQWSLSNKRFIAGLTNWDAFFMSSSVASPFLGLDALIGNKINLDWYSLRRWAFIWRLSTLLLRRRWSTVIPIVLAYNNLLNSRKEPYEQCVIHLKIRSVLLISGTIVIPDVSLSSWISVEGAYKSSLSIKMNNLYR